MPYPADASPSPASNVQALRWTHGALEVLDQRQLPERIVYETCTSAAAVAEAIASMRVRGAPAIGIAAAYGAVLAARARYRQHPARWRSLFEEDLTQLAGARPTAVNLFWALRRMRAVAAAPHPDPLAALADAAVTLHREDIAANQKMGELGADRLGHAAGLLTHCNTGALATGGYGTALGVIRSAFRRNQPRIYATETRPWLQGSRLTLWELAQDHIPATLIADSAAAHLMRSGRVQWLIVGADRIAANGDTANKIGTYTLAVAARYHGVRVMVVAPTSTIDFETPNGSGIEIEERAPGELLNPCFLAPSTGISAWNPVFDVTPAELIDAIVTERGVASPPHTATLAALRDSLPG